VAVHPDLGLLAQARGSRLLAVDRRRRHRLDRERAGRAEAREVFGNVRDRLGRLDLDGVVDGVGEDVLNLVAREILLYLRVAGRQV
jgi:hypothetical protein